MTNKSATLFGFVAVLDDSLTAGPELSSKLVGRAQEMYASASQKELGLLMVMNFAFREGQYNGVLSAFWDETPSSRRYERCRSSAGVGFSDMHVGMLRRGLTALTSNQEMRLWSIMFMLSITDFSL